MNEMLEKGDIKSFVGDSLPTVKAEGKDKRVVILVSESQKNAIMREAAKLHRGNVSDFVRELIFKEVSINEII
jgi:hypothetical protein